VQIVALLHSHEELVNSRRFRRVSSKAAHRFHTLSAEFLHGRLAAIVREVVAASSERHVSLHKLVECALHSRNFAEVRPLVRMDWFY